MEREIEAIDIRNEPGMI